MIKKLRIYILEKKINKMIVLRNALLRNYGNKVHIEVGAKVYNALTDEINKQYLILNVEYFELTGVIYSDRV